ncbi:Ras- protein Rab-8B [Bonamia ostreae]|uniref:Ras- protein Rab-8B n=1 Tax=Bonamia ostreae TaxID=126728 RepID=A0ABV2AHY2_9EUKA
MASKTKFDQLFKIVTIGDSAVGKSSVLIKFTEDIFDIDKTATIGVDFKTKNIQIDGKIVKLQIWDTAGQERFRTITNTYYRDSDGIILMFDVTNRKTFENVQGWISNIKKNAPDYISVVLIGNKIDLEEKRQVKTSEGKELAAEHNYPYIETSAFNSTNVQKCFFQIANMVNEKKKSLKIEKPETLKIDDEEALNKKSKKCC